MTLLHEKVDAFYDVLKALNVTRHVIVMNVTLMSFKNTSQNEDKSVRGARPSIFV